MAALLADPIYRVLATLWDRVAHSHADDYMDEHGNVGPLDEAGRAAFMVNSLLAVRQDLDELYGREVGRDGARRVLRD